MKAIYINLDPYLAAFAAWLKAGKPGTAPSFDPLPLAVTVPLGQDVAVYAPWQSSEEAQTVTIDGQTVYVETSEAGADAIEKDVVPALSALAPSLKYAVEAVSGASISFSVFLSSSADQADSTTVPFTILVRRETASGPVDLVDFTPPLSLAGVSFAGVDIEGAEFDGNEIVADADTGALSAPAAGG